MIEELHLDNVARLDVVGPRGRLGQGDGRRRDLAFRTARGEHRKPEREGKAPHAGRALRPGPAATRTMGDVHNRHGSTSDDGGHSATNVPDTVGAISRVWSRKPPHRRPRTSRAFLPKVS